MDCGYNGGGSYPVLRKNVVIFMYLMELSMTREALLILKVGLRIFFCSKT